MVRVTKTHPWLASSPENLSEALFLSQVEFSIANGELANGQGQPCYSPKLLNRILRYCTHSPWVCVIKVCSNSCSLPTQIIAKDNLNIANLMKNFENLILRKYSTEF